MYFSFFPFRDRFFNSSGGSSFKVFILPPLTGKENLFQGQPLFVSLLIKEHLWSETAV